MRCYSMFTPDGDAAVDGMVERAAALPLSTTQFQLMDFLRDESAIIAKTYPEVHDTDVREHIAYHMERLTKRELSIFDF